jgi:O-antigen/teichoic acid export membrane protein
MNNYIIEKVDKLNGKLLNFIKNMSYTISSNLLSLLITTLIILFIPKIIGIEEYGYWQLYLVYSSYVGFFHFGWNDGIYLRFGGQKYYELDKKLFFSQFVELFLSQIIFAAIIFCYAFFFITNTDRKFVIQMVSFTLIIVNSRLLFFYILQATKRVKDFALISMFDRIIYAFLILILLIIGYRDYKSLIIADLLGKFSSLVLSMILCKDIVFRKLSDFYLTTNEIFRNIRVGMKLMVANMASALIIGIVRLGIERTWDIATFGKVSLTLSISNLMMIFINAIGIILFPILRRTDSEKLVNIYSTMRNFLMLILLGILILYYPIKTAIAQWLPQYSDSLLYMALIFPIFIYEGKMALLINTYLKTLRCEKAMLRINLFSMFISLIMTFAAVQIFENLIFAIVQIVILLSLRSTIAETYLTNKLKINLRKDVILEFSLTLIFILSGWFINTWFTVLVYGLSYMVYLFIKKNDFIITINNLKLLIKA